MTFGRTPKYSQGLKLARIEGSRFRKCHRATGGEALYYIPPSLGADVLVAT
jgi:hypothetical protein